MEDKSISIKRFYKHNNCDLLLGMDTVIDRFGCFSLTETITERELLNDQFLLLYTQSGNGTGKQHGESFTFTADDLFVLLPHEKYQLMPDKGEQVQMSYFSFDPRPYSQFYALYRDFFCKKCISVSDSTVCREVFNTLLNSDNPGTPGYYVLARALLIAVLGDMLHMTLFNEKSDEAPQTRCIFTTGLVNQAVEHVTLHPEKPINIDELAKTLHVSENTLYKTFIASVGMAPKKYLTDIKIMESKKLLSMGGVSLTDVAERYGFSSPSHYSLAYKRIMGHSPRKK